MLFPDSALPLDKGPPTFDLTRDLGPTPDALVDGIQPDGPRPDVGDGGGGNDTSVDAPVSPSTTRTDWMSLIPNTVRTAVYISNGDGTFTRNDYDAGPTFHSQYVWRGDFNGDGKDDWMSLVPNTRFVAVYTATSGGNFTRTVYNAGPAAWSASAVLIGDFNGDGKDDWLAHVPSTLNVAVFLSQGNATFQRSDFDAGPSFNSGRMWRGDFDGDGKDDWMSHVTGSSSVAVYTSKGDGTFLRTVYNATNNGWHADRVWVGDWDGDGKDDWMSLVPGTLKVAVYLSTGGAQFARTEYDAGPSWDSAAVWVGDFNGDDRIDWMSRIPGGNYIAIYTADGTGKFNRTTFNATSYHSSYVWLGDWNADGKVDWMSLIPNTSTTAVYMSQGSGLFTRTVFNPTNQWTASRTWTGDWDGQ
ncbi:MAG: VCBS repeat-containing protein [Myxococcales bacterium]|nr:VCBS repeat-containing protein [Myxococcales bacterium]